jgi:hypothetical protein
MKIVDGLKGLGVAVGLSVLLSGSPAQSEEMDSLDALIDPAPVVQVVPVADQSEGLLDAFGPGEVRKFLDSVDQKCNDGSVAEYSGFVRDYVAKNGELVDGKRTLSYTFGGMYLDLRVKGNHLELMLTAPERDNPHSMVSSYFVDKKADGVVEQAVASVSRFKGDDVISMMSQLYALNGREAKELLSDDCVNPQKVYSFDTPEGQVVGCLYDVLVSFAASMMYIDDCCSDLPVLPQGVRPEAKPTGTWL